MGNICFGYRNHLLSGALAAGSEAAGLDIGRIQDPHGAPSLAWQTGADAVTPAAGAWFTCDMGAAAEWRGIGLFRTNLTAAAQMRVRIGTPEACIEETPALLLDFAPGFVAPAGWAFTRADTAGGSAATVATRWTAAGVLEAVAPNTPRIDHDPVTLAVRGLLREPARTRANRNPRGEGAVAGSPGTLPTHWAAQAGSGMAFQVAGAGTEDGIPYVDLRVTGTSPGGGLGFLAVYTETGTGVTAANGETWTYSQFHDMVGLAAGNLEAAQLFIAEATAGGDLVTQGSATVASPAPNVRLATGRVEFTRTLSGGGTVARVRPVVTYYFAAGTVDATIRIGLPQLEQGGFATSPILSPAGTLATATRGADTPTFTPASGFFAAAGGTIHAAARKRAAEPGGLFPRIVQMTDGTTANDVSLLWATGTNTLYAAVQAGGALVASIGPSGLSQTLQHRITLAYAANDFRASVDGGAVTADTGGAVPPLTTLALGTEGYAGWIRRLAYYNRALSSAQIQALSASDSTLTAAGLSHDSGLVAANVAPGYRQAVRVLPAVVTGRVLRVEISDPANPDRCINVPLAFAGPLWQLARNFGLASALEPEAAQQGLVARGGQEFVTPLFFRRRMGLVLPWISDAEFYAQMDALLREAALGRNILTIPDPDGARLPQEAIFGTLESPGTLPYAQGGGRWRKWQGRMGERL